MKLAPVTGNTKLIQRCNRCNIMIPRIYKPRCPVCAGMVEIHYNLSRAQIRDSDNPVERYFDILPIVEPENYLDLGAGRTPCAQAPVLGDSMGLKNIFLKLESYNPTGTTKDRMAAVVLSMFRELGIKEFVSSSTGNSSNALAYGIQQKPYFVMHLFIGGAFADRLCHTPNGVKLYVLSNSNFTEAFNYARSFAQRNNVAFEAGFFNPARREGLKLAYLEAVDQIPMEIDWYFQAVSSAMGVHGVAKGAMELQALKRIRRVPRMVCVQQESCAPIVRAFEEDCPAVREHHIVRDPDGIAKAILRGDPSGCYPYVYEMLKATNGHAVSVTEAEIRDAQTQLERFENLSCGITAATTIAALQKLATRGVVQREDCVLLNLTD